MNNSAMMFRRSFSFDANAAAFLTACLIPNDGTIFYPGTVYERTGAHIWKAVNDLVVALKDYSIWDLLKIVYPIIGGTQAAHKFNLKNPTDTNAANRLNFQGDWVHSATGAKPDGSTGYADTFFNPATDVGINSGALGYYSRTNNTHWAVDIGIEGSNFALFEIHIYYNGIFNCSPNTTYEFGEPELIASGDTSGFYQAVRTGATTSFGQRNQVQTAFTNKPYRAPNSGTALIGARRSPSGAMEHPTNRECAFAYFGDGLTGEDAANLYEIVQAFQAALGREV